MAEQGGFIISGLLKGLKDNIGSVLTWIGKIPGRVKDKLSDAKDWLVETGGNVLSGLKDGLSEKWDSIGDWFQDLPNKISNAIPDLFNTGKMQSRTLPVDLVPYIFRYRMFPYPGINTT